MNQRTDHAPVIVNPFVIYLGLAFAAILLQQILPLSFISGMPVRILGVLLIVLNFVFGLPALWAMLRAKTSPNPQRPTTLLLLSGPYRFSRNPMYIGLTLLYAGLMAFFQFTWGILFLPIVIGLITVWVIRPEEEYLEHKFGNEYRGYKETVHRWI